MRSGTPIDVAVENDTSLLYGEIAASPLKTIEAMLSSQFAPLFSTSNEWGHTNGEQKTEFGVEMNRFAHNVGAALDSLSGGLELKVSEQELFDNFESADTRAFIKSIDDEPDLVHKLEKLLEGWCQDIESYVSTPLDSIQPPSKKANAVTKSDVGPKGELDFWRGRMQRLNSITEQFQSHHCKQLIKILAEISKGSGDRFGSNIPDLLRRWKQIDVSVTEAANEAKDNIKYLSSLQRFVGPLYDGTVGAMTDAVPALLNSVKVSLFRKSCTYERLSYYMIK